MYDDWIYVGTVSNISRPYHASTIFMFCSLYHKLAEVSVIFRVFRFFSVIFCSWYHSWFKFLNLSVVWFIVIYLGVIYFYNIYRGCLKTILLPWSPNWLFFDFTYKLLTRSTTSTSQIEDINCFLLTFYGKRWPFCKNHA